MKKFHASSHENGVALIFALGLLTLLSVLGVAFVTNSLNAQKVAANIGARDEAQQLLDSAVNRVMISLMTVLRQDKNVSDYSIIYSTNDGNPRTPTTALETRDQLDDAQSSKLNVVLPGQPKYDGSKSQAGWVYLRDADGNITGRMAYQVLPTGTSSMSLDQVLKGIYNPVSGNPPAVGSPAAWARRIGFDIREFNVGLANNDPATFAKEWKFASGSGYDDLPGDASVDIVASFDNFFEGNPFKQIIGDADEKKVWLRRWFSESKNASPEAFLYAGSAETKMGDAALYHRFNLGPLSGTVADPWYARFKTYSDSSGGAAVVNREPIIEELLGQSSKVRAEDKRQVFCPEDTATRQGVCLPYLTRICADQGSFSSRKERRQQIAANLNDYCDGDNIPTSDVPADEWSNDKKPAWTGNEKTPYINEFVVGMKLVCEKVGTLGNFKVTATPRLLTELISIYKDPAAAASFQSWLSDIVVNVTAKVTGTAAYGETTGDFTDLEVSFSIKTADGSFVFPKTESIPAFSAGYSVVKQDGASLAPVTVAFDQAIAAKLGIGTGALLSVTYSKIELKITGMSCKLQSAVLRDGDNNGIDFVRGPGAVTASSDVSFELNTTDLKPKGVTAADANVVYLSGMEARDPRQNLNFNRAPTTGDFKADTSDWKCVPVVQSKAAAGSVAEDMIGSIKVDSSSGDAGGSCNSCSSPAAPFSGEDKFSGAELGDAGIDYDKEKTSDPAWKGDGDDEHISTAFIRNAPMQSLWELGAIHRGSAWETINIKRAVMGSGSSQHRIDLTDNRNGDLTASGVAYENGDGVILDQVKLTGAAYTSGKLDVNMILTSATPAVPGYDVNWDKSIVKALFCGIRHGQQLGDIYPANPAETGTPIGWGDVSDDPHITRARTVPEGTSSANSGKYISRADFIEGSTDPRSGDARVTIANGFGLVSGWSGLADAQQEEIIGKTANLLTAGATAPTTIQAVVVVQTIKSIVPPNSGNITVFRQAYKKNGDAVTNGNVNVPTGLDYEAVSGDAPGIRINGRRNFRLGSFVDNTDNNKIKYVYFDEITSELRALVTVKRVNFNGEMRFLLYNVRYL
ncbi:MAG: hypothetical protein IJS01_05145 [Lentisphaeria bacterium]|nr:hypothetical protein [Lentisphaeria bacterium]